MTTGTTSNRWRALALLAAAACALLLPGLGRMHARETTDARYLEVAREMEASGDWLVPRLAGLPHLHKPPLAYWAGAAGFRAFGVRPFAGRFLEQLALVATALVVYAYGRSATGARGAAAAAGVFLTSGLVFATSRSLNTDLFQLLFFTGAMWALQAGSEGRARATALGFALLGASMLAKGPIALAVALVVLLPYLALRRGEARLPWRGTAAGAALFLAVGLPWYLLLAAHEPGLLRWFLERQILARVTGGEGHRHGIGYFPVWWVVGLLPWTPLVLLVLWRARPWRGGPRDALELWLWLWAVLPVFFFEVFATKLATYLLPAFPATALLVGRAVERRALDDPAARRALAASLGLGALAALGVAVTLGVAAFEADHLARWLVPEDLVAPAAFALALAAIGAALAALGARALRGTASLPLAAAAVGAALLVVFQAVAPAVPDCAAEARLVRAVPGARVIEHGDFHPGLLFYLGGDEGYFVAVRAGFVAAARRHGEAAHLALRDQDVDRMMGEDVPTFVFAKRSKEERLAGRLGARAVRRTRLNVLLANEAARRALARLDPDAAARAGANVAGDLGAGEPSGAPVPPGR